MEDFETYCEVNLNPEIICRMCLEPSDNLQNIFVQEIIDGQLFPLPKLFQKVLHIRVMKNDTLPQKICSTCKSKLIEYQKFRMKCESSHKILHDVLQPGYEFRIDLASNIALVKNEKKSVEIQDAECQTEIEENNLKSDPVKAIFNDAMEYFEIQIKTNEIIELLSNETDLHKFCQLYSCFVNDSKCLYCSEIISNVAFFHTHMKKSHEELLNQMITKLYTLNNETEANVDIEKYNSDDVEAESEEQVVEIEELEEEPQSNQEETYTITPIEIDDNDGDVTILVPNISTESYRCPICHKLLRGEEVEKHKNLHQEVLPPLFENIEHYLCVSCNSVFITIEQVQNHYLAGNNGDCMVQGDIIIGSDDEFESLPELPQQMQIFGKKSDNLDDALSSEDEPQTLEIEEITMENTKGTLFFCGVCQTGYSTVTAIRYHTFNHYNTFVCSLNECQAEFDFAYKLLGHYKYVHLKGRLDSCLMCPHCKIVLESKKDYLNHLRETCDKRTITCDRCSKKFFNIAALKNHEKTHETLLQCEECSQDFSRNADLRAHMKQFHLGEKLYKCSICDKRFRTPSHRLDHEQSHNTENKYQCEFCQLMFKSERVLKAHRKLHTVGKSHACPICGKLFHRNYHVKLHMKVHGGESVERIKKQPKEEEFHISFE